MKTFHRSEKFTGKSYTDMINQILGTHFDKVYEGAGVPLDGFELPGVIAWFVFMDGSTHGYAPDYLWENRLIGNTVTEELVSKDHTKVIGKDDREGHRPLRLAFELLECEKNFCKCRFVGAFALSHFLRKDLTAREYVKVMDDFTLKSKGEVGKILNTKADFIKDMPKYATPIGQMGFSKKVLPILIGNISTAGELLELGIGTSGTIADEIRQKLYEHFKKPEGKPSPAPIAASDPLPDSLPVPEVFVGMAVTHKTFGEGKIVKVDGSYISVAFSVGEKPFVLPQCFEKGFLKVK